MVLSALGTLLCHWRVCMLPLAGQVPQDEEGTGWAGGTWPEVTPGTGSCKKAAHSSMQGCSTLWTVKLGVLCRCLGLLCGVQNSCKWAEHCTPVLQFPHFHLSYLLGFHVNFLKTVLWLQRKGAEKLNLEEVLARQTTMSIRSERQGEDKWENE